MPLVDLSELVRLLECDFCACIERCECIVPVFALFAESALGLDEFGVAEACVPMLFPSSCAETTDGIAIAAAIMINFFIPALRVQMRITDR